MKKAIALLMTAVLAVGLLSGCSAGGSSSGKIKIGVSIWSYTDALGSKCKEILDQAAEALDVELKYVDQAHVSELVTESATQLANAGCQGIIICNSSDAEMASVIKTCDQKQVYLAQFFRTIDSNASAEVYKAAKASPYYVGSVHENEVENGQKLLSMLLDAGYRNVGLIGWEEGDGTWLLRWRGYQLGANLWNSTHPKDPVTLTDPLYAGTTRKGGKMAAETLMKEHPEIDAIIPAGGGGEPLLGALEAIDAAGKTGQMGVVSTDFLDDLGARLEDSSMTGESGGHYCDPLYAFLLVYNAIRGEYKDFEGTYNEILFPYLYVSSVTGYAGYDDYRKYFVDQLPYTQDEIREMSELSFTDLSEKAAAFSIEDTAARAGNG